MKRYIPTVHGMMPRDDGDWVRHSDHIAALDAARAESAGEVERLRGALEMREANLGYWQEQSNIANEKLEDAKARVVELEAQVERDREWDRDHA